MNTSITSKEARKTRADKNSIEPHRVLVTSVLWFDKLSVPALWRILKNGGFRDNASIRFMEYTYLGWFFFLCLRFFNIIATAVKIKYSMGDMRSANGESLQYECWSAALDTTMAVVEDIKALPVYNGLASILPPDKVALYFEKRIYNDIFPLIRFLCIVRWYIRTENEHCKHIIIWPNTGFFGNIQRALPDNKISLVDYRRLFNFSGIRSFIKKKYNWGQDAFASILPKCLKPIPAKKTSIAVHYAEGIDFKRRSDLFWYPDSQIDADRVIIYFDRSYNHRITKEHVKRINSRGMRWLALSWRRDIPCSLKHVWRHPLKKGALLTTLKKSRAYNRKDICETEKWFLKAASELVEDVEYWKTFYKMFNVKIHIDAVEGGLQNVVQNIALDLVDGIHIGKQRSEWSVPITDTIGYYPDHVFFSWNSRSPLYLDGGKNRNDYCIVAGFPYDAILARNRGGGCYNGEYGGRFVVALYDNMFGDNIHYSKSMMLAFYRNFLEWAIEDEDVVLIIKSKKPVILTGLHEIHDLLTRAKVTKRCIIMGDVFGRLASDALYGADIAVGIGISSAVTEAVIVGYRGVHCDLTSLRSHPFYQWGYEKVVFDDIDKMMVSLKRYKENPNNEPELGDWSLHLDELDPFRDGRGGERIGTYIRCLLEVFKKGGNRDEAIRNANKLYSERWGSDKVITLAN